jgi:hypothetical protein
MFETINELAGAKASIEGPVLGLVLTAGPAGPGLHANSSETQFRAQGRGTSAVTPPARTAPRRSQPHALLMPYPRIPRFRACLQPGTVRTHHPRR